MGSVHSEAGPNAIAPRTKRPTGWRPCAGIRGAHVIGGTRCRAVKVDDRRALAVIFHLLGTGQLPKDIELLVTPADLPPDEWLILFGAAFSRGLILLSSDDGTNDPAWWVGQPSQSLRAKTFPG